MIRDIIQYGATMAKVKVLASHMLTKDNLVEMMSKKTVGEVAAYLKQNTNYHDVLDEVNPAELHRNQLEALLYEALLGDFKRIYRFENGENRKFYRYIFLKNEIECLKLMLRMLENDELSELDYSVSHFLKKHFTIDIDRLQQSKNIREFMENLQGSRYEKVVAPLIRMEEHQNLFSVEMTLDLFYFTQVTKLMNELKNKKDKKLIRYTIGSEADLLNLLWIYRCKKYYSMQKEIIYSFIIPNRYRLTEAMIKEMVEAPNEDALMELIGQTPYKNAFRKEAGEFYDRSYYDFIYQLHRKVFRENPFSISTVISYVHFKEIEIRNITSITEGIRYSLPPDEIRTYVTGLPSEAG